jgi:hypothetical protein
MNVAAKVQSLLSTRSASQKLSTAELVAFELSIDLKSARTAILSLVRDGAAKATFVGSQIAYSVAS